MIVELPVYHMPDGSREIGEPDPRHGIPALKPLARHLLGIERRKARR